MLDRRSFLAIAGAVVSGCTPPRTPAASHDDLEEATIADLTARMQRGELTATDLVTRYLARIDAIDRRGPTLMSVIETNPDVLAIAARCDEERRAGKVRGPLHGIPILVKDNIDTGDRMQTTAGSLALAGAPAPRDATAAARLRDAGAILLGKTNLSEWANMRSTRSTSGWSARGGLTKNPYALDRNTSGSSSGSAAAVAANLCAAALGSETDGSIVSPSSLCGIVGMKPTLGLVSRTGIIPIAHSQDTAGPMTRSVADAALLLQVLAGEDPRDPATAGHPRVDYAGALAAGRVMPKRIGVLRGLGNLAKPVLAIFDAAVEDLRRLGATVVDGVDLGAVSKLDDPELLVLLYELKADMARYLEGRQHPSGARTLDDLLRFNTAHAREELAYFGQEHFEAAVSKGGLDTREYLDALATCRRISRDEGIDAAMTKHRLDALVAPTGGPAWITDLVNGDAVTGSTSTPAAVAGYPSITVPAGHLHGLPIGVSFFGGANSESVLLAIAHAYEQATRHRRKPQYLASVAFP
jgi:amidase